MDTVAQLTRSQVVQRGNVRVDAVFHTIRTRTGRRDSSRNSGDHPATVIVRVSEVSSEHISKDAYVDRSVLREARRIALLSSEAYVVRVGHCRVAVWKLEGKRCRMV